MGKRKFQLKACSACGEEFIPVREWQYFCSARCRFSSWKKRHTESTPDIDDLTRRVRNLERRFNEYLQGGAPTREDSVIRERRRDGGRGKENAEVTDQRPALVAASRAETGGEEISALRIPSRRSAVTDNND
jgi:hypothetical protein